MNEHVPPSSQKTDRWKQPRKLLGSFTLHGYLRYHFVDLLGNKVDLWGNSYSYNGSSASGGDNTIALHTWLERISPLIPRVHDEKNARKF